MNERRIWPLIVVIVSAAAWVSADVSGAGLSVPIDPNPMFHLMPALPTASAPGWTRQGVRITYYSAAASIVGGRHQYPQDETCNPNDPRFQHADECYKDANGKYYRQKDVPSASGHGYTQVNVVLLDRSVTVLDVRTYGLPGTAPTTPAVILGLAGAVGVPGAGGDFWLNPQVLRGAVGLSGPALQVLRMPYAVGGKPYRSIRIQSGSQAWVYDEATGVLLHSNSATQGGTMQGPMAQGGSRQGSTLRTLNSLVEIRPMNLPWASSAAPGWVAQVRALRYEGTQTLFVPGSPAFPIPVSVTFVRRYAGLNWARYTETMVIGGIGGVPPNTVKWDRVFGPAQIGGLWIAPQALAQLRPGDVLDSDRVTRVTASVGQIERTPQGIDVVHITEQSDGNRIDYHYDRYSGMLVYVGLVDSVLNSQTQIRLVQRQ
jgi:hypothetical protein